MVTKRWALLPAFAALLTPAIGPAQPPVQLGMQVAETTDQLRQALGVSAGQGALVMSVDPHGPAAAAGLRAGDVLTRVDNDPVADASDIHHALADHAPGDPVAVDYVRDRHPQTTTVTVVAGHPRGWQHRFSTPKLDLPPTLRDQLNRFRERVERELRDLDQRLRRLENPAPADPT